MDYSKRLNMIEMFQEPPEYKPPGTVEQLAATLNYPNMNSQQYRMTRKLPANVLHPCLECVVMNDQGLILVAGNDFMGRRWGSSLYGWDNINNVMDDSKASFKRQNRHIVTTLKFTRDSNLFVLGNDKGAVELWSTQNPARGKGFSLYLVDSQSEHIEGVSSMDLLESEEYKLVTGSNDGCLKVWIYGADLQSISTMAMAHIDEITGISSNAENGSLFATSSLDRSCLLWDLRKPRPASAIFDEHKFGFSTVYWTSAKEANEIICLGDEAGNLHFVDIRQPGIFLDSVKVFDRKIHKISFNAKNMAVLGNTNQVKFYDEKLQLMHECIPSKSYLRDVLWDKNYTSRSGSGACWLAGWESFFQRVEY
ncbi:methylosome protein 50-like [Sabethes cyaneus]|uniref:methylosome protein 50-like n=1 Tax=Sabethes cyaneus TaxID=53552 RepID=UPI00237E1ABA|nr:methylosome protein 50-like [Sabethes cyaneus]